MDNHFLLSIDINQQPMLSFHVHRNIVSQLLFYELIHLHLYDRWLALTLIFHHSKHRNNRHKIPLPSFLTEDRFPFFGVCTYPDFQHDVYADALDTALDYLL